MRDHVFRVGQLVKYNRTVFRITGIFDSPERSEVAESSDIYAQASLELLRFGNFMPPNRPQAGRHYLGSLQPLTRRSLQRNLERLEKETALLKDFMKQFAGEL